MSWHGIIAIAPTTQPGDLLGNGTIGEPARTLLMWVMVLELDEDRRRF